MNLSMFCSFILLLSFVPGVLAQSRFVTVDPATAKLGKNATMTYTFTPAAGDVLLFVAWYKSDENGAIQGNNIISNQNGNTEPNGRYSQNSNGELIISHTEKMDTGYYLCIVTTTVANTANGFSNLTVFYVDKPIVNSAKEYVCENNSATLTCPLPDGVPTPITITWIKDGDVLDVSDTEKYPQSDTTLEISRVNKMDEGDYQCRAENAAYSGSEGKLSDKGTLLLPYVNATIVEHLELQVTEFQSATFTCIIDGAPKPLTTTWIKLDDPEFHRSGTILKIDDVSKGDAGDYKCRVRNAANCSGDEGELSTNKVTLTVKSLETDAAAITYTAVGSVCIVCGAIGAIAVKCGWLLNNRIWIGIFIVFGMLLLVAGIILFVVAVNVAAIIVLSLGCIYMVLAGVFFLCSKCGIFEKQKDALKEKEWFKNVDFRIMLGWAFLAAGILHIIVGAIYVGKTT